MTISSATCAARNAKAESCGGAIRPSYIETVPPNLGDARRTPRELLHAAECERCGTRYEDEIQFTMTGDELHTVAHRMSESTRQELQACATEVVPGSFEVKLFEDRARDFAAKAANLGLVAIAAKVRQEMNGLTLQRRKR